MKRFIYVVALGTAIAFSVVGCTQAQTSATPSPAVESPTAVPSIAEKASDQAELAQSSGESMASKTTDSSTYQSILPQEPGMNKFSAPGPGQVDKLQRSYPGSPPQIPHNINGLSITRNSNGCVGCHSTGIQLAPDHVATKIPDSHYMDLQTGEIQSILNGRRYNCVLCHVPQSSAKPLSGAD